MRDPSLYPASVKLPDSDYLDVHRARNTPAGIEYLRATGRFRDYMQTRIDSKTKPFLAWDGEGWTDDNLDHHYMLLMNSNGTNIHAPELTTLECLELILKEGALNPGAIHIIFGGGYDASMMLKDLPDDLQLNLRDDNTVYWNVPAAPGVTANTFQINYLPHKWLKIRGYDWYSHKWVTVKMYDVMTYFQSSFIKALDSRKIAVSDEIRSGKASRSDFTYDDIEEIRVYCQQELESLVMLANQLREEITEAGVYVTQWHGPATIAKAFMRQYKIRDHMQEPTPELERAFQHAYFGGHFGQYGAGHYDSPVYLYDINSAYPHAIRNLPSLAGATWEWTDTYTGEMGVWLCTYDDGYADHYRPHPVPWRGPGGSVGFPTRNREVWLWTPEAGIPGVTVLGGYQLHTVSDYKPFAYIPVLYNRRLQWKNEKRGGERALKLAMNSSYGVLAQRIGGDPSRNGGRPALHQLAWAGMVTSTTRRMIWDAISQKPDTVIAVETDSIMTTEPLDLDIGEGLGQWGLTEYQWVTYVQNGIYFTDDGIGKTRSKTRGIDAREISHDDVIQWLSDTREPLLTSYRQFIGLGNPRRHLYGQWQDSTKEVKVAGNKRIHNPGTCPECAAGRTLAESMHPLMAAPHYGLTPSSAHSLPWIDGGVIHEEDGMSYVGDAIEEYDVERRTRA